MFLFQFLEMIHITLVTGSVTVVTVQRRTERLVNLAKQYPDRARQSSYARAIRKFSQPRKLVSVQLAMIANIYPQSYLCFMYLQVAAMLASGAVHVNDDDGSSGVASGGGGGVVMTSNRRGSQACIHGCQIYTMRHVNIKQNSTFV